jgi:hypothetical protein
MLGAARRDGGEPLGEVRATGNLCFLPHLPHLSRNRLLCLGLSAVRVFFSPSPVPHLPHPIAYSPSPLSGMLAKLSGSGYSVLALDAVRR